MMYVLFYSVVLYVRYPHQSTWQTIGGIGHHKQHQHRVVTDINIINLIMIIVIIIINHKHQLYIYITICWPWSSTQGQASPNLSTLKAQTLLFTVSCPTSSPEFNSWSSSSSHNRRSFLRSQKIWSLSISGVLLTVSRKNTAIRTRFTQTLKCKGRTVSSPKITLQESLLLA